MNLDSHEKPEPNEDEKKKKKICTNCTTQLFLRVTGLRPFSDMSHISVTKAITQRRCLFINVCQSVSLKWETKAADAILITLPERKENYSR